MSAYSISVISSEPTAAPTENSDVLRLLREYNGEQIADKEFQGLTVVVRDEAGTVKGGCIGRAYWGWLEIEYLAVAPELRRLGYGAKLLSTIEAEAIHRGCHSAYLDTFSFQARPFYEKQGYQVFGTLLDFPPGHKRYFLTKRLAADSDSDALSENR